MDALASVRLTANLNSMIKGQQSLEQAERAILGPDVAHHVLDPDGVLGLDPLAASSLDDALERLKWIEPEGWFLALPVPGSLGPLRGPAAFNRAALEHGEAVVASTAGVGLVPIRVGQAVQWRVYAAERPLAPTSPYDAERALNEMVLSAAAALSRLDVACGPPTPDGLRPAAGPRLQHPAADDRRTGGGADGGLRCRLGARRREHLLVRGRSAGGRAPPAAAVRRRGPGVGGQLAALTAPAASSSRT